MPEVHVPHLDEHDQPPAPPAVPFVVGSHSRTKSIVRLGLEVLLIGMGVFLGLAGEQWRQNAEHRENAELALRRFRTEVSSNRAKVEKVREYHATTRTKLKSYLSASPADRKVMTLNIEGIQVVFFEHTAWDLALATQSLAYIDPDVAVLLSRIYNSQEAISGLTSGVTQAMYVRPPTENTDAFLASLAVYYDDLVHFEPELMGLYDEVLARLDRMLERGD